MKTLGNVCLWAGMLALMGAMAAPPVAGTWDGNMNGVKAVTLKLQEQDGRITGTVVFYIMKDEGSGLHNGSASPETPLTGLAWSGQRLKFSVVNSNGEAVRFEMQVTGADSAVLTANGPKDEPERRVNLERRK